jgi:hypothetical protein
VEFLLDVLGPLVDGGPVGMIGRRRVKRYEAGERVFVKGTVSSLAESPRWTSWLVAADRRLCVANEKRDNTVLYPLPKPSPGSTVEECPGTLTGKPFHYRYQSANGFIEVYPAAPAKVVKRALEDMHVSARPSN